MGNGYRHRGSFAAGARPQAPSACVGRRNAHGARGAAIGVRSLAASRQDADSTVKPIPPQTGFFASKVHPRRRSVVMILGVRILVFAPAASGRSQDVAQLERFGE